MSEQRNTSRASSALALMAAAATLAFAVAVPRAQQAPQTPTPTPAPSGQQPAAEARQQVGGKPAPTQPAPRPAQKPLVPIVASTLAAKPEAYVGENVTMMAIVDQSLSPIAFSVDQDKAKTADQDVLVLAPRLNEPLELNTYVTVIGEVVKFDPADAKVKDRLAGIAPEVLARYTGKPAIVAT